MKLKSFKNIQFLKLIRFFFTIAGIFFLLMIMLAFTSLPYWGYYWLGTSKSTIRWKPEAIILLGGSGMPSESNLMRSWFAASAARDCPECILLIVMPGDTSDSISTPVKMKKELINRGVNPDVIKFESKGTNTRSQALETTKHIEKNTPILIITSPEHMRRSVQCFRKVGFEKINALPAFEDASEADFSFIDKELGGRQTLIPDVGKNTQVRYQVWNHLKYEILIARELLALSYYWIRGWI
jgi:uncharacterized SAM-binding protein YcdF (DUF218 family)